MHIRDIFSIFYNMKVCCLFSLESPRFEAILISLQNFIFELRWLEHLLDHENKFETEVVRATEG